MSKWTIENIKETGDITFAMCILSERMNNLNPYSPLAEKLKSALHTLEEIRGGAPTYPESEKWESIKERAYREKERYYLIEDIKHHVLEENHDLSGLAAEDVLADEGIIKAIIHRFNKFEGEDGWYGMESSVEEGIKDVLKARGGGCQ